MNPIHAEFKRRFSRNAIATAIFLPIAVLTVRALETRGAAWLTPNQAFAGALIALAFAAGYAIRTWRCPGCEETLGRAVYPTHCPSCKVELR